MRNTVTLFGSAATVAVLLAANPAYAAGTAAGLSVTNTVTVNYQVGGVSQTAQTASDTFTVDRKVNVTVAEVGTTTTTVSPGQSAAVTTFQVTNLSNATLDFALAVAQQTGGAGAHSNTDSFDATNLRIYPITPPPARSDRTMRAIRSSPTSTSSPPTDRARCSSSPTSRWARLPAPLLRLP